VRIAVFGLGYVGTVTAACLARDGHTVVGVDVNPDKVGLVRRGESPIIEPQLSQLLQRGVEAGRITATTSSIDALAVCDVSLISVGTPAQSTGEPDLGFVILVSRQIAEAAKATQKDHVVVLRSTVPPGTLASCQELMKSTAPEVQLSCAFNPEFLREGSAVADYDNPPYTIIGTSDAKAERAVREMYSSVSAPVFVVAPELAEMVKYIANAWHATKIGFANEVGRVAKSFGVDGRDAMHIATQDTKLNISPAYMKPGFAYGGSCLPKDVGALTSIARARNVNTPLLNSLAHTNQAQIEMAVELVMQSRPRRVAILGLAFKPGTDDLRESPAVILTKRLIGEGCAVRIYDREVREAKLVGTNLAYIRSNLPHFEALLDESAQVALRDADTAVITYASREFTEAVLSMPTLRVIDLPGAFQKAPPVREYRGAAW